MNFPGPPPEFAVKLLGMRLVIAVVGLPNLRSDVPFVRMLLCEAWYDVSMKIRSHLQG